MTRPRTIFLLALVTTALAQTGETVQVQSRPVSRIVDLPGEFQPYLSVQLRARVSGYVERVLVDRGSVVQEGQLLAQLSAPEMKARIAEAESKVQAAEADGLQAEAQLAGARANYERLRKAAETPGAVAGNELVQAEKQVEAGQAAVHSREQARRAAQSEVRAQKDLEAYLRITAPFSGVVTERLAHPGALVGPGTDPILVLEQVSRLRLVVAVPEVNSGAIVPGAKVEFRVPAAPERHYSGTVARNSHSIDVKTRTMAVELDVYNRDGALAPGMYPTVKWPVREPNPGLFVPKTSVVTTAERTFVIRARDRRAEWVDVRKGPADGDLIQVTGHLEAGDPVVRRASDEIRNGSAIQ